MQATDLRNHVDGVPPLTQARAWMIMPDILSRHFHLPTDTISFFNCRSFVDLLKHTAKTFSRVWDIKKITKFKIPPSSRKMKIIEYFIKIILHYGIM
jgi:hypothetical protein